MKDKDFLKFLIPVIAVVVIFESVMLVSQINKKQVSTVSVEKIVVTSREAGDSAKKNAIKPIALGLVFATKSKEMKIGDSYAVEINMIGKGNYFLDAVDLYVKYNPEAFTISNLTYDNKLPKPTFSKVSPQKSVVAVNYLITEPDGFKVGENEIVPILKFNVVPKKAGSFDFEVGTGIDNKESATMFIENASSETLSFSGNKLNVNVLK